MPLGIAPLNKELTIDRLLIEEKLKKHFYDLGIMKGKSIMLVCSKQGDLIVKVKSGRIAINRGLAMKIFVQ